MKPQVLHRVTSQNVFTTQITVSAVESWNKILKQNNMLLKDLSPNKIKGGIPVQK